jgi:hypothetical protein
VVRLSPSFLSSPSPLLNPAYLIGVPTRGFGFFGGGGGGFSKSIKQGSCDVSIRSAEINYSKNNMKCTLKFEVGENGGGRGGDSDDGESEW